MKQNLPILAALLLSLTAPAPGQNPIPAPATAAAPKTELQWYVFHLSGPNFALVPAPQTEFPKKPLGYLVVAQEGLFDLGGQNLALDLLPGTPAATIQAPPAPAVQSKPDAATELKAVGAPYHAAVETVSADYQKWIATLETWYLGELDKLKAARAKLADLDGALAIKAERERVASHSPTTPEQIHAMPAPLRTLRAGYDKGLRNYADEGARRIDVARRKYLADLEALQKRITTSGDIDQALVVKAEKDRLIAELAAKTPAAPPPATPPKVPVPTPRPPMTAGAKAETELVIEAFVDGGTLLHVRPDSMHWEVEGASKVGMWQKHNEPTFLNGKPWMPRWRPRVRNGPDISYSTPVSLGTTDLEFQLLAVTDRQGDSGIDKRTPTDAKIEGREFIVRIPDQDSGAKWYKFVIRKKQK